MMLGQVSDTSEMAQVCLLNKMNSWKHKNEVGKEKNIPLPQEVRAGEQQKANGLVFSGEKGS